MHVAYPPASHELDRQVAGPEQKRVDCFYEPGVVRKKITDYFNGQRAKRSQLVGITLAAPGAIIKVRLQRITAVLAPRVLAEGFGHTGVG